MNHYYLIAQLPSLDGIGDTSPLPITEARFAALCEEHLGKRAYARLAQLTLSPPQDAEKSGSALIDAWNRSERLLRIALAHMRAERRGRTYDGAPLPTPLPTAVADVIRRATVAADPMQAERILHAHRLATLETLRPADAFSEETLFYYALKLKLLSRMRAFDRLRGENTYLAIYHSILHGDDEEVVS